MVSKKRKAKAMSLKVAEGPREGQESDPPHPRQGEPRLPGLSNSKGAAFHSGSLCWTTTLIGTLLEETPHTSY